MNFDLPTILIHAAASYVATVGFALVFQCPWKLLPFAGIPGLVAWMAYFLLKPFIGLGFSMLVAALLLTFVARCFAVGFRCPLTVFLVAGIIPLVPGTGIFLTLFHLLSRDFAGASENALGIVMTCGAILLGITLISMIPQRFFNLIRKKEHRDEWKRKERP